jgi:hypothetical protein
MAQNIANGHKIYQKFPFQGPLKFTQIGIFGLKINHLATLQRADFQLDCSVARWCIFKQKIPIWVNLGRSFDGHFVYFTAKRSSGQVVYVVRSNPTGAYVCRVEDLKKT